MGGEILAVRMDRVRYQSGEAVARAFFDRWNAHDADGIGELFADDADFVNVVGLWWRSRRAIRKAHAYDFDRIFANAHLDITELKIRELTPDIHVVHTVSILTGQTGPNDEIADDRMAVISLVAERRDSGFVIVSAQNTDRIDGADTNIASAGAFGPTRYR
ncbi:SgcJ/EcaC family oxidoreductase [Bauldia sp.]|uniref:SgcJ/EcaC family oxidoreductase n=1 Tax=Bauldia sp. TaxID=2575872 RepID=UPI003BA8DD9D